MARPLVDGLRTRTLARRGAHPGVAPFAPFAPTSFDDAARAAFEGA